LKYVLIWALTFVRHCIGFCRVWHAQHLRKNWAVWALLPPLHLMQLMQWNDQWHVILLSVVSWFYCSLL